MKIFIQDPLQTGKHGKQLDLQQKKTMHRKQFALHLLF